MILAEYKNHEFMLAPPFAVYPPLLWQAARLFHKTFLTTHKDI